MVKKPLDLTGLVATKGSAAPLADAPSRAPTAAEPHAAVQPAAAPPTATASAVNSGDDEVNGIPLNFRVTADLRRRFRMFAAAHDLKLNELLRLAFDAYEKTNG